MEEKKEVKLVTKGTDELMFGWKLPPITLLGRVTRKYYQKYGTEIKGVTLTSNKPLVWPLTNPYLGVKDRVKDKDKDNIYSLYKFYIFVQSQKWKDYQQK